MEKPSEKKPKRKKEPKPLNRDNAKRYTCIICPACCELETDGLEVNGATCPRGEDFARQETVMPLRVVTTTVRASTSGGDRMVPVKTTSPVPIVRIPQIMKAVKALHLAEIPPYGSHLTVDVPENPLELVVTGAVE